MKIGGSLIGGEGDYSGSISPWGGNRLITVRGSIIGGNGNQSGAIIGGADLGAVKIGGSLLGGDGNFAGAINVNAGIESVTIGGSVVGGTRFLAGSILAARAIGLVKIGGDLIGGSIEGTEPALASAGYIQAGRIGSVLIGGSVTAGTDQSSSGNLTNNASIRADDDIGAITIKGGLIGNENTGGITYPTISARGQETLGIGATSDLAIQSVTIGGRVEFARVLAGFGTNDPTNNGSNGNASIGAVKVGGDWSASSISAGVEDVDADGFGDSDDGVINTPSGAATDALVARIASITIHGIVIGAPNPFFQTAFTAQQIGSFKAGAYTAPLTAGTDAPIFVTPYTANVTLRELP